MACAYRHYWDTTGATINYSSLLSDYNNADKPHGGDCVMDIGSGQFTCLTAGHYTVTFSGSTVVHPGQEVRGIYLYHNGERVEESRWLSYSDGANGGRLNVQGSRTVTLHLAVEDTLELRTDYCTGAILDLIYCVSLTGFDY